jgi:hypothetical protein
MQLTDPKLPRLSVLILVRFSAMSCALPWFNSSKNAPMDERTWINRPMLFAVASQLMPNGSATVSLGISGDRRSIDRLRRSTTCRASNHRKCGTAQAVHRPTPSTGLIAPRSQRG